MKKEKTIRSYKRKTKSGKVVTVKQHTAKYDAAEEMKKALAKKGAGEELATRKLTADEMKQVKGIVEENSELDEKYLSAFYPELSPRMVKAVMTEYRKKSATPKAKAANTAGKTPKPKTEKSSAPDLGFTDKEFKAWYHWDTESDPKNPEALKVKKALVARMGPRAYKSYEQKMTDSYSSRGHTKAFSSLPELVQARQDAYNSGLMEKTAKAQKAIAENYGAKEAAAKHGERAKSEGAKRKAAVSKVKELSPKRGDDFADLEAAVKSVPKDGWDHLDFFNSKGKQYTPKDPAKKYLLDMKSAWKTMSPKERKGTIEALQRQAGASKEKPVAQGLKPVPGTDIYVDEGGRTFKRKHKDSGVFVSYIPTLPKSASFTRGTARESVSFIGKPVWDKDTNEGYLALGKRKGGKIDAFFSHDGKKWEQAEGWDDAPSVAGTTLGKLIRDNGYGTKQNKAYGYLEIVQHKKK